MKRSLLVHLVMHGAIYIITLVSAFCLHELSW